MQPVAHSQRADDVFHGNAQDAAQDVVDFYQHRVAGGLGHDQVKLKIRLGEFGHVALGSDHPVENRLHLGHVVVGGAFGGQRGGALLDDPAILQDVEDVGFVQSHQGNERIEVDLPAQFAHEGAFAMAGFKDAQGDEVLDPFTDGDPADAHGPGEFVLGGDLASGGPRAAQHLVAQLAENLDPHAFFLDGF